MGAPGAKLGAMAGNAWNNAHNPYANTGGTPESLSQTGLQSVGDLYSAPSFGLAPYGGFGGGYTGDFGTPSNVPQAGYGNWGNGEGLANSPFGGNFFNGGMGNPAAFDNSGGAGGARGAFTFHGYGSDAERQASMEATQNALRAMQATSRHADGGNRVTSLLGGSYTQAA